MEDIFVGEPNIPVGPESHPFGYDLDFLAALQSQLFQDTGVPIRHWLDFPLPDVVRDVENEVASCLEHPDALVPDFLVELPVPLAPGHAAGVVRVKVAPKEVLVGDTAAVILGVMVVGHAVPEGGRSSYGVPYFV